MRRSIGGKQSPSFVGDARSRADAKRHAGSPLIQRAPEPRERRREGVQLAVAVEMAQQATAQRRSGDRQRCSQQPDVRRCAPSRCWRSADRRVSRVHAKGGGYALDQGEPRDRPVRRQSPDRVGRHAPAPRWQGDARGGTPPTASTAAMTASWPRPVQQSERKRHEPWLAGGEARWSHGTVKDSGGVTKTMLSRVTLCATLKTVTVASCESHHAIARYIAAAHAPAANGARDRHLRVEERWRAGCMLVAAWRRITS